MADPAPPAAAPEATKDNEETDRAAEEMAAAKIEEGENPDEVVVPSILSGSGLDPKDALADVLVQQDDPNSPLYSVHSFEELGLTPTLLKGIYTGMGFNKPSKIQETALPMILGTPPKNLIAQAHNGSGKTACFTLGMLARIDESKKQPQALCLVNTRELARQTHEIVKKMAQFTSITCAIVVPDGEKIPRGQQLQDQIIVGTPGRTIDLLRKRVINARGIKIFVLDEADNMIDQQGLADQSIRVKKELPASCQMLLFSATFPPRTFALAKKMVANPNIIHVKKEQLTLSGIKQFYFECSNEANKFEVLEDIYGLLTIGQSIIFVNTKVMAEKLTQYMRDKDHTVSVIKGGKDADTTDRDRVMDEFREGKTKVLISTDVLSRGIDVLQVSLVINFDIPAGRNGEAEPETYLHRIGRTGRFGRKGVAINLVHDQPSKMRLKAIQDWYENTIELTSQDNIEELEKFVAAH
eukprot:GFYU01001581.1.p1 GENE.GFYU01001581.1~~GFYU01001581.1.p1  ORF type:complete len:496 (+),score=163.30 GFYU01001581.1:87-1490(+)